MGEVSPTAVNEPTAPVKTAPTVSTEPQAAAPETTKAQSRKKTAKAAPPPKPGAPTEEAVETPQVPAEQTEAVAKWRESRNPTQKFFDKLVDESVAVARELATKGFYGKYSKEQVEEALTMATHVDKADSGSNYTPEDGKFIMPDGKTAANFAPYQKVILDLVHAGARQSTDTVIKTRAQGVDRILYSRRVEEKGGYTFDMREVRATSEIVEQSMPALFEQMLRVTEANNLSTEVFMNLFSNYISLRMGNLTPESQLQLVNETLTNLPPEARSLFSHIQFTERHENTPSVARNFDDLTDEARIANNQNTDNGNRNLLGDWFATKLQLYNVPAEVIERLRPQIAEQIKNGKGLNLLMGIEGAAFQKAKIEGSNIAKVLGRFGVDATHIGKVSTDNDALNELIKLGLPIKSLAHDIFGISDGFKAGFLESFTAKTGIETKNLAKHMGRLERKLDYQNLAMWGMLGYGIAAPFLAEAGKEDEQAQG